MSNTTARRLTPELRRARILDASLRLFALRACDDIGLEEIAAEAGVTRNLLYHYFDSKRDLHRAAVHEAGRRLSGLMDVDPNTPLAEKLPANVARWLDAYESRDPALFTFLRCDHEPDPVVRAMPHEARNLLARAIAANHLGRGKASPALLAALVAYLALCQRLCESWAEGSLTRAQVQEIAAAALPPIVAAAR